MTTMKIVHAATVALARIAKASVAALAAMASEFVSFSR